MGKSGNTSTAHIVITMEGKAAQETMTLLSKKAQQLRADLEAMEQAGQIDTEDYKKTVEELNRVQRAINQNRTAYINLKSIVANLNKTTLRDLQRALKECRKQMNNLTAGDPKMKVLMAQYRAIDNQIGKITGQYKRQTGVVEGLVKRLSAYVGVYGAYNFITGQIGNVTAKNVELSDSLADIRKVSGLSAKEVNELSDKIHALDTRTASDELHQLAFNAGRLGIQGVDGILQFVKAGNQINVALGEDLGQDALVQLMKMNEVMGTIKELGIEKSLLATGSAINTLSASSTASGEQIADFASRLSGIAAQANITTDELLGLGSASSALNMQTEVAATAFNKFINEIVAHTSVVAKAAGIEKEALDELLKSGKTMEAVVVVLEALNGKGGLRGLDPIMKDLGSDGARLNQVLAAFSKNTDVLRRHLNISTDAFREATSVTQEYNIKNENAAAILARIKNALVEFTVNSAFTAWLEDVLRKVYELPKAVKESSDVIIRSLVLINTHLLLLKLNITSFTKIGLLRLLVRLRAALVPIGTTIVSKLIPAVKALFGVLAVNPILTMISAVGMLGIAFDHLNRTTNAFTKSQRRLKDLNDEYDSSLGSELTHLNQLKSWLDKSAKGTEEYNAAKEAILKNYGKYLTGLGKEIETLENVTGAYNAITEAATNAAKARMAEKGIAAANENFQKDTGSSYKAIYDKLLDSGNYSIEEIDRIMARLRQTIDNNSGMPADIQEIIDSFQSFKTFSSNYGPAQTVEYNPLAAPLQNLRNSKKALDDELFVIRKKYGDIKKVLATDPTKKEIELPDEPKEEKTDSEKLEEAKKEHRALMNAIEAYYKQQDYVINEAYLKKKISATKHEQELSKIQETYRNTRMAADKALLNRPGAIDAWNEELQRMQKENLSKTQETSAILSIIWKKNLKGIGDDLRQYGEGEMESIWKSLEKDKTKIQEEEIEMRKEIENILSQNDFERIVMERFSVAMQKLKILFPKLTGDIKKDTEAAMGDLQALYPKLFDIDINTDKGLEDFKDLLKDASHLGEQYVDMEAENLRLLYFKALEYGDAMTEAQKKTRDRNQKIADEIWRATGGEKREQGFERQGKAIDTYTGQLGQIGLSSEAIANDAEIKLYEERVKAASEYRDLVVQMGGDVLSAEQKLNESIDELSAALVDKTLRHLETLKSFVDPVEDFGTKLGEAFAMDDAIERQEAFADALKNLVGDVGEATKKMIIEWVKQKIQHSITRKAMAKAEKQSQKEMTGAVEEGQEAETALMQVGGAIQQELTNKIGAQVVQAKKAQAVENVTTQASETTADAALGIAGGAAKTIGQLGWWGIPLVAVISAVIGGLLSAAMSKVGSLFGGAKTPAATAPTKLVTGMQMLTYDNGNVQSVLGNDGHVYSARMGGINGSGLVTSPVLTNVNGQAALVGEQGPEIVIGRTTTRALMQNNPGLLAGLVSFDKMYSGRGFRTYAGGNMQQFGTNGSPEDQDAQTERVLQAVNAALLPTLVEIGRALDASSQANRALQDRLSKPIPVMMNKYGRGGLIDEVATGLEKEKKSGRNDAVRRLFN